MNDEPRPLGYEAAEADWNFAWSGRRMEYHDWASLTCGEQARYAAKECETKGAVYTSQISADTISFSVKLPPSLEMKGLSAGEAERLESYMHRKLEEQVTAILRIRSLTEVSSHG